MSVGRVLIADDDPNIRAALVKLIALEESLEVVGQARDADEAIQLARELQPDAALMDVNMPRGGAHRAQVARVRAFIRGEGLSMLYQPVLELSSGRAVGVEALARFAPEPGRPAQAWFEEAATVGYRNELELATIELGLRSLERLPP